MATKKTKTTKTTAKPKTTKKAVKKTGKALASRKKVVVEDLIGTPIIETTPKNTVKNTDSTTPFYQKKQFIYGVLGLIILSLIGYYSWRYLVIGTVDGQPLSRLSYYKQLDETYGKNFKEQMFTETLFKSEAKKQNLKVEPSEVDAEIQKYQDQMGGAALFEQSLIEQGYTIDDVRKNVELQLLVGKIFADQTEVTDEEVSKFIADNQEQFTETNATVSAQVKEMLVGQKLNQAAQIWLSENLQGNRVVRY